MNLEGIDHIAITVTDLDRSIKWYKEVLNLEPMFDNVWEGTPFMIGKGNTCLALFKINSDNPKPNPGWDTIAAMHIAFRANRENFETAQKELKERGIKFRFADHGISHSIYFKDPDGQRTSRISEDFPAGVLAEIG